MGCSELAQRQIASFAVDANIEVHALVNAGFQDFTAENILHDQRSNAALAARRIFDRIFVELAGD